MAEKCNALREKILNEFQKLVLKQGYAKTTLRQVADICEMSKGHVGFYFKRKEEIIIALTNRYFCSAYEISKKFNRVYNDEILHFSVYFLFVTYILSRRKETYFYMSEMYQNSIYLNWRIHFIYDIAVPIFIESEICNANKLHMACVFCTHGLYGAIHQSFLSNEVFDYKLHFTAYMQGFFAQIGFSQADLYIEKAFQVFDALDQEELSSQIGLDF